MSTTWTEASTRPGAIQRGPYTRIGTCVSYGCGEPWVVIDVVDAIIQYGFSANCRSGERSLYHVFRTESNSGAPARSGGSTG